MLPTPWPLPDEVFARVEGSRDEVWAQLARGQQRYDVYLLNDRGGIYALGFPVISPLDHLVNLAELTVLARARLRSAAHGERHFQVAQSS